MRIDFSLQKVFSQGLKSILFWYELKSPHSNKTDQHKEYTYSQVGELPNLAWQGTEKVHIWKLGSYPFNF